MILYLILKNAPSNMTFNDNSIICGVDYGSIEALNKKIKLDYAIGDFDSVSKEELELLKDINLIKLNQEKDDTDTLAAINYFYDKVDEIIIYGGIIGKRVEHLLANINLVLKYKNITIIDENSIIRSIKNETILKSEYHYISFFANKGSSLTLKGFKYNLDNYIFKEFDSLCISNEILNVGEITFNGNGVIILTKYDK